MSEAEKKTLMGFILERFKIQVVSASILFITSTVAIVVTPAGERIKAIWNSPDTLSTINEKLDYITNEVRRATGEDRIFIETGGMSYVNEPVYRGDNITLHMTVRRTNLGAACIAIERTPFFTDETNIATAGIAEPVNRQMTINPASVAIDLSVPEKVRGGRVTLYLAYEFDCGGVTVFNSTNPVAFMLQERK